MRVSVLTLAVSVLAGVLATPANESAEPELLVSAHFPEENPFHHVVNGEKNKLFLLVENRSEQNSTIKSAAGSFHDPESQALVKNISTLPFGVMSPAKSKFTVPYIFHSQLKPGDYSLHVWIDHAVEGSAYRVIAYEGIVTVVEPELSIFDFKMLSTYAITAAVLAAGVYFTAVSFFPSLSKPKKKRSKAPDTDTTASVGAVKASGTGYEEEWIPEHHLKKTSSRRGQKKANEGVLSSGDEKATSGPESSTEGLRRSKRVKKT